MASKTQPPLLTPSSPLNRTISESTYVNPQNGNGHWIPAGDSSSQRNLILCFDGTGDKFDEDVSNVIQFVEALYKDDRQKQVVYYQTGIGTYTTTRAFFTPIVVATAKLVDTMFAATLQDHVIGGYNFLMQNYNAGDKISIFGFSRGAFIARALAGMLAKIGLLSPCNDQQIPIAWNLYKDESKRGLEDAAYFKRVFSTDVMINFVGVWDTVASVAFLRKQLPFVANNTTITYFRHALALDERRANFMPEFYHACKEQKAAHGEKPSETDLPLNSSDDKLEKTSRITSDEDNESPSRAKEVWFAGCHCDVGGGSVRNNTRHSLARIPLRWMIRECFACETGIIFDSKILREKIGLNTTNLYPKYIPRVPSDRIKASKDDKIKSREDELEKSDKCGQYREEYEDFRDALSAKYDQLEMKKRWKIPELLLLKHTRQDSDYHGKKTYHSWNRGKGRAIYGDAMKEGGLMIHSTVKTRLEAQGEDGKGYIPSARITDSPKGASRITTNDGWLNADTEIVWID